MGISELEVEVEVAESVISDEEKVEFLTELFLLMLQESSNEGMEECNRLL